MRIQHNIMSMNAYRNYSNNTSSLSKNLEKLSSGYRINRAGDDAAGLAISEKMRAQITGLTQAQSNAKSGINLVQTAEGALQEVHDMLNRMVQLADQSANGTYDNAVDRANLQKEVDQLKSEIDRIADGANFNGINLLDGSLFTGRTVTLSKAATASSAGVDLVFNSKKYIKADGTEANLQFEVKMTSTAANIKATATSGGKVTITIGQDKNYSADDINKLIKEMDTKALVSKGNLVDTIKNITVVGTGVAAEGFKKVVAATAENQDFTGNLQLQIGDSSKGFNKMNVQIRDMHVKSLGLDKVDISSQDGAGKAVDAIKAAINTVSSLRGDLGATQNRLDHTINNLSVMTENIQDSESTIRDTDVADEMMKYTKNNILVQSAQAMLAQANQVPQGVLQLLQ